MNKRGRIPIRLLSLLLVSLLALGAADAGVPALWLVGIARGETAAESDDLQKRYEDAQALFDAEDYEAAYNAFEALQDYDDSEARAADSKRKWKEASYNLALSLYKEEKYYEAREMFTALDTYEKSRSYVKSCTAKIQRIEYKLAKEMFNAGDYEGALALFESLGRYKDSRERAQNAQDEINVIRQAEAELVSYDEGLKLMEAGDLDGAFKAFLAAGDCKDSTDRFYAVAALIKLRNAYRKAESRYTSGDYRSAGDMFAWLGDYEDSADMAEQCFTAWYAAVYDEAKTAQDSDPARAYILLITIVDYEDSAELAGALRPSLDDESIYKAAEAFEQASEYEFASVGFSAVSDYSDSGERAARLGEEAGNIEDYKRAQFLRSIGEEEQANAVFKALGDYSNAAAMVLPIAPRFTTKQLRDDKTTPVSPVFTAPDGSKHCYQMYKGVATWLEAKAFCEALGGHLATLTSAEENQFVHSFMLENGFYSAYFGLSDLKRTGDWVWVTGEPFEYTNWHRGEPSYSGREKYGMYFYKHTKGTWNDSHFYEYLEDDPGWSYICEWDLE